MPALEVRLAGVAQLVERRSHNPEVVSFDPRLRHSSFNDPQDLFPNERDIGRRFYAPTLLVFGGKIVTNILGNIV